MEGRRFSPGRARIPAGLVLLLLAAACLPAGLSGQTAGASGAAVTRGTYRGPVFDGLATVEISNPVLKVVTVPERGGRVAQVIHLKSGRDFVNLSAATALEKENGIYERLDPSGRQPGRAAPDNFMGMPFKAEAAGPGSVRYTCQAGSFRVERVLTLDPALPRLDVRTTYTNVDTKPVTTQFFPIYQLNTNQDRTTLYDVLVFPDSRAPGGFKRYPEPTREFHFETQFGWFFISDLRSREAVVVTHRPNDPIIDSTYSYKVTTFQHLVVLGREQELAPQASMTLEVGLWFISGAGEVPALAGAAGLIGPENGRRLQQALAAELAQPAPGAAAFVLPKVDEKAIYRPPVEKPRLTLARIFWDGVYANPEREDFLQLTSSQYLLEAVAEVNAIKPDLLVIQGGAYNGLEKEYADLKKITGLARVPVSVTPGRRDKPENWLKSFDWNYQHLQVEGQHLFLLPAWSFLKADGRKALIQELEKELAALAGTDRAVILCPDPPRLRQNSGKDVPAVPELLDLVNRYPVVLYLSGSGTNLLQRDGKATVVGSYELNNSRSYQLIRFYPDRIEVDLAKPLGDNFSPVVTVPYAPDLKRTALYPGLPAGEKRRPDYFFVHLSDSQFGDSAAQQNPAGRNFNDFGRFLQLTSETNRFKPAFLINSGDLVERGTNEEQWRIYLKATATSRRPVHTAIGNHDAGPEHYTRWTKEQPLRLQKQGKDAFIYLMNDTSSASRGEGLSPELMARLRVLLEKSRSARQLFLVNHFPLDAMPGQAAELKALLEEYRPTLFMAGHTHNLGYEWRGETFQAVANSIGWTKQGPNTSYTGYFINYVFPEQVVVVYKPLYEDVGWSVTVPNPRRKK
ncbi:MAG TPA: metallophosphoesterase family protein [bacterium]|nr:metallophosphoesterase family protein [bacterium]HNS48686.1 metallophosphoesterase family protein [bacterium]